MSDPIDDLIRLLSRLPGIGERTAARLAFHVLGTDADYARSLGTALAEIHDRVQRCELCGNYGAESRCAICLDARRDRQTLCVVARVQDLVAIERVGTFRGTYFVLHALLAPLEGAGADRIPVERLLERVRAEGVAEVVIATPVSVEGEATALFLVDALRGTNVKTTRIASGVPHGGELEFADQVTLARAIEGRRSL